MTYSTTELKTLIEAARTEAAVKIKERIETAQLEAQLRNLTNEALLDAKANLAIVTRTSELLKGIEAQCQDIIASMPIMNTTTRENRKWNPSRQYGFGNQIALLTGILSGIQYSAQAHKDQMLALTGLSEDLIEQTLEAFGATVYYSPRLTQCTAELPYDIDKVHQFLSLVESTLGCTVDRTKLTEPMFDARFEMARNRAIQQQAEHTRALELGEQLIQA